MAGFLVDEGSIDSTRLASQPRQVSIPQLGELFLALKHPLDAGLSKPRSFLLECHQPRATVPDGWLVRAWLKQLSGKHPFADHPLEDFLNGLYLSQRETGALPGSFLCDCVIQQPGITSGASSRGRF
jgi:hypothetical protein